MPDISNLMTMAGLFFRAAPSNLTQEARARILLIRYLVRRDDAVAIHQE
jgi:hypothetical protein